MILYSLYIICHLFLSDYYSTEENSALLRESVRMMDLDHPNVLGLIGVCVDAGPAPYLVMPYMAQGSLLSYLNKHRPDLVFFEGAEQNEDKVETILDFDVNSV